MGHAAADDRRPRPYDRPQRQHPRRGGRRQLTLFGGNAGSIAVNLIRSEKDAPKIDRRQLLDWEKELIGVYLSEHPLQHRLADLQSVVTAGAGELDGTWNGKGVTLAGLVAGLRTLNTKKGQPMAFVTLEDLEGKVDCVFFPKVWAACRELVQVNQILVVRGQVQAENENVSILVQRPDEADRGQGRRPGPRPARLGRAAPARLGQWV